MSEVTHRDILLSLIVPPPDGRCFWCAGHAVIHHHRSAVPCPACLGTGERMGPERRATVQRERESFHKRRRAA